MPIWRKVDSGRLNRLSLGNLPGKTFASGKVREGNYEKRFSKGDSTYMSMQSQSESGDVPAGAGRGRLRHGPRRGPADDGPQPGRRTGPELSATRLAAQHATTTLPSFADLAEAVDPAVVSIQAATIEKAPAGRPWRPRRRRSVRVLLRPARPPAAAAAAAARRRGRAGPGRPGPGVPLRRRRQRLRHQPRRPGGHQQPRDRGRHLGQGPPRRPRLHGAGQGRSTRRPTSPCSRSTPATPCATSSSATATPSGSATG